MTRRDVIDHLLITRPADRRPEAEWLLKHLPPYGDGWAEAKAQLIRLTNPTDHQQAQEAVAA